MSSTDAYVSAVYRDTGTVSNHIILLKKLLEYYPNPSSGLFQIEIPDYSRQSKFEIFNTMGRLVQTGYLESNVASIDMKNSSKGTYVLRLTTEAMVYTELLIIK